jgi:hypothetical protein
MNSKAKENTMKKRFSESRRRFFKGIALMGGSVALAKLGGGDRVPKPTQPKETIAAGKGYRLTPHVEAYYRTAD